MMTKAIRRIESTLLSVLFNYSRADSIAIIIFILLRKVN